MGLLPAPWAITGLPDNLAFHALLEPAKEVGGDLYDAFMLDEHHFSLWLAMSPTRACRRRCLWR